MDGFRSDSTDRTAGATDESLADGDRPLPDDLHWVLTDEGRCTALVLLRERKSVTLAELADEVARSTTESAERLHVSLDRHHLPVMAEAGLLEYDRASQQVRLADLSATARERIDRRLLARSKSTADDDGA
jgi:hypothetical protein